LKKLKKHFWRLRPHEGVAKVLFHLDSVRPHAQMHTPEAITELQWTVLPHSSYSLDLDPFDYHLFGPLKDAISRKKFEDDDDSEVIS
jgi:hypothetical protein